ncbi:hypothetical protein BC833DRAFT_662689 [Globomyces pollinis-pini]|nr:hypothetical protein BC833DRAFT_662689 [Globomyces pollinis-pini]
MFYFYEFMQVGNFQAQSKEKLIKQLKLFFIRKKNFLSNPYNATENPLPMVKKRGRPVGAKNKSKRVKSQFEIVEGLSKCKVPGHNARACNKIWMRVCGESNRLSKNRWLPSIGHPKYERYLSLSRGLCFFKNHQNWFISVAHSMAFHKHKQYDCPSNGRKTRRLIIDQTISSYIRLSDV